MPLSKYEIFSSPPDLNLPLPVNYQLLLATVLWFLSSKFVLSIHEVHINEIIHFCCVQLLKPTWFHDSSMLLHTSAIHFYFWLVLHHVIIVYPFPVDESLYCSQFGAIMSKNATKTLIVMDMFFFSWVNNWKWSRWVMR
jgi:hypothetical protein